MTFAFFLGAGNLIFPPMAGLLSGQDMLLTMLGFLLTAVGLPLIALIAVAKSGGKIFSMLPVAMATGLASAIYIIIGPAFAAPRTGLVAYEIGAVPFISDPNETTQLLFTLLFFAVSLLLALKPGKLLDTVGKMLTPILIILLTVLAASVVFFDGAAAPVAAEGYKDAPFVKGFLDGYNTMDTLASLLFGMLIIDILKTKGITEADAQAKYLVWAGIIAAIGLAYVYISLFVLGSHAAGLAPDATNGGEILSIYVFNVFGDAGQIILAAVVSLACLTTAVGLISACSDFFGGLFPKIGYQKFTVLFSAICALVANVGLEQLIAISVPVLYTVYPVAIALVVVTFFNNYFGDPKSSHRVIISTALFYGALDGLAAAGVDTSFMKNMMDSSLGWVVPVSLVLVIMYLLNKKKEY